MTVRNDIGTGGSALQLEEEKVISSGVPFSPIFCVSV